MSTHNIKNGINTLRKMGVDINECDSIENYYSSLHSLISAYSNNPGKLYWIYSEIRMIKVKEFHENATEIQKMICLCHIANRFISNRSFYLQKRNDKYWKDLYKRLDTIEVISNNNNGCKKCKHLDGKRFSIMKDIMGGDSELENPTPTFKVPKSIKDAMDSCSDELGCMLCLA